MFDMSRFITSGRLVRAAGTLVLLIGAGAGVFRLVAQARKLPGTVGPVRSRSVCAPISGKELHRVPQHRDALRTGRHAETAGLNNISARQSRYLG